MKFLQTLGLILVLSVAASAQKTILAGKVYDQSGGMISGVEIAATDVKNVLTKTVTDENGIYQLSLESGDYKLSAKSIGFEKFSLRKFKIAAVQSGGMNLDISLQGKILCVLRLSVIPRQKQKNIKRKNNK